MLRTNNNNSHALLLPAFGILKPGKIGKLAAAVAKEQTRIQKNLEDIYIYIYGSFFLEYNITRKSAKTRCAISTESELI